MGSGKGQKKSYSKQRGQQGNAHKCKQINTARPGKQKQPGVRVGRGVGRSITGGPCTLGYGSKSHPKILDRGVFTFYKAYSAGEEK